MILSQSENIERYDNGNISYIETIAIVAKMWVAIYPNHRVNKDGQLLIRVGENIKYNTDGSVRWEINYSKTGDVIK